MKALGCQPVESTSLFKVLVSDGSTCTTTTRRRQVAAGERPVRLTRLQGNDGGGRPDIFPFLVNATMLELKKRGFGVNVRDEKKWKNIRSTINDGDGRRARRSRRAGRSRAGVRRGSATGSCDWSTLYN